MSTFKCLGRKTKGNLPCSYHSLLHLLEGVFCRKYPIWPSKAVTEPYWRYREIKKAVFNIVALIFRKQYFFESWALLLTRPLERTFAYRALNVYVCVCVYILARN